MSGLLRPREPWPRGIEEGLLARLSGLDAEALLWVSGYALALARGGGKARSVSSASATEASLAVVYASQTGQARRVAERLARALEERGNALRLLDAAELNVRTLAGLGRVFFAVSTHGDGDPPDAARALFAELAKAKRGSLARLGFAVLALGDSSYPRFCAAGRWLDQRLVELGAERLLPLAEADLDIERVAAPWQDEVLAKVASLSQDPRPVAAILPLPRAVPHGREHPLKAELLDQRRITFGADARDVRHLVLGFDGDAPPFEPGDALGVVFAHDDARVERVLAAAGLRGEERVEVQGQNWPIARWLAERAELTRLSRRLVEALAAVHQDHELRLALEDASAWQALVARFQVAEALARWPRPWTASELSAALTPLSPRLYSLAGSRSEEGEVAVLTVGVLRTETPAGPRTGACSGFLAGLREGQRLEVFWEPNPRFRLPEDDRDLVMIAAGTGIAPFRAFLQERIARGSRGRHWLIYGARRLREDFLYQLDWLRWRKRGALHRLSLAFSREPQRRAYVQDRLREEGSELLRWLSEGAAIYVCGGTAMGQGVEAALLRILESEGRCSPEEARERLLALSAEGRYRRDLY
ncbi:MAG: sulfite reductase [NADPH] flavoprotein alpha-component [Lysobacterales bacterium]|nr:MAG: sulfite reductase [NADPH] flavoprotein alpha-component [Xanthomonadales bacterium]